MQVYVFTFGIPRHSVENTCDTTGLIVVEGSSYRSALEMYCGKRANLFEYYPTLHRWLVLKHFAKSKYQALLYVDTDTCFLSNPKRLFEDNAIYDWYTREEPCSTRSHLGYDSSYLNETTLSNIATRLDRQFLPPMNIGVILMNHAIWERIEMVLDGFFADMWGFLVWLVHHGDQHILSQPRMRRVLEMAARMVTAEDLRDAIVYPSSNCWILDEIGMLLALGRLRGITCGCLQSSEVLQGYEFAAFRPHDSKTRKVVLCHYYSKNHSSFMAWYEEYLRAAVELCSREDGTSEQ